MEDENITTTAEEEGTTLISTEGMPEWLVGLIERLMQVFTKLMIKLGIKLAL